LGAGASETIDATTRTINVGNDRVIFLRMHGAYQDIRRSGTPDVRRFVAWMTNGRSLAGTVVVPALHPLLNDSDVKVAVHAMWALSLIADPRSIDPIISRMSASPELRGGGAVFALSSWEAEAKAMRSPHSGETFIVVYV
jgi:hypothetical protein